MSEILAPVAGDNLKLLCKRFSSIKECLDQEYADRYIVRDAKDKITIVAPEPELDTHMHKGWYETNMYIPYWKVEHYNKEV